MKKKKVSNKSGGQSRAVASRSTGPASPMDVGLLEQMVKLMAANDLNTVDVRDGEKRVILRRGPAMVSAPVSYAQQYAPSSLPAAPAAASNSGNGGSAAAAAASDEANLVAIKSPMVGTFYSASSPDAKPFVQVGSTVDEDSDVCIIEAMKVFNNIKAETRGTIAKMMVTNGQTVEFGQTLFLVKP